MKYSIAPLALAAVLAGCATTDTYTETSTSAEAERIQKLERELVELRTANSRLKTQTSTNMTRTSMSGDADLPPAKPGECYARILIPANYKTTSERVVDQEASERLEIIPAKYKWGQERVLVAEASERLEVVPATYKTVTETIIVEPAREELRTIPAKYRTETERVLVREAYTTWKKGEGPIGGTLSGGKITDTRETSTGEIMCLIEVPAEYNTVTRKVLVSGARTEKITVPAKTKTVTKRVVATPATTRTVTIPAKYSSVKVRKLVSPASERRIPVPATYRTVSKKAKVSDERLVWREILCETNTTPDVVRRVQQALRNEGYNVGVDGILGANTMRAVADYQRKNKLGTGGLTIATVKKLGVM